MQTEQFQLHADIELRHWWFVGRRRIMRRLVAEVLPPSADATIVDVGCGTGANIAALADRYRCVGIDTSRQAVELARQRFPGVQFITGCAPADLGELAGRARLFMLMDVLEHVADDFAVFSELLAAAAPGSHLLLTVPADESLWSAHDEAFGHYRRYTRRRLECVWSDLPVKPLLVSCFNARLLPLIRMIRARSRRRGKAAGEAGTDFRVPSWALNRALQAVFAGEARALVEVLRRQRSVGYRSGASLVALLRRKEGQVERRRKPHDLPPDRRPN